jgi:two-component system, sensor histidine kinase
MVAGMPPTVLVIDDQDASRFAKVQTLRRAGFHVHEASTGQTGLAALERVKPDILILDVNLPDISGLEISRRLRDTRDLDAMPILQISNTAITAAEQVKGLEQGADVYLTEPIDATILVATVRALLRARQAEAALAGALERERHARGIAEEASRVKDDFIATLSHELRTPLNALMGWIFQLRHSKLDENARERALDSLERNARVQAQLIDDLLDISRISKGKLRLHMQVVELRSVIDDVVATVRAAAAKKRLTLTVEKGEPCLLLADRARLQQVLTNLLSNAVQYTPELGSIDVRVAAAGTDCVVQVRDTGAGIDPDFLPHVFDPFRQGESTMRRSHGGLGLGLSVVNQLVELHGGTVSAESAGPGSGSTFTVVLPAVGDAFGPPAPDSDPPLVLSGVRVLVAHHAPEEPAAILEASGAEVEQARGADLGEHLARRTFDVVVTDMPAESSTRKAIALPTVSASIAPRPSQLVRDVALAARATAPPR